MTTFSFLLSSLESELTFRKRATKLKIQEIQGFEPPSESAKYVVIADEKYNIGTAYYCKDSDAGAVYRVCPEYSESFELVNTSVKALRACLKTAAKWSAAHDTAQIVESPDLVAELETQLTAIDPGAFTSRRSHWPIMLDHIAQCAAEDDDECMELWFRLS